MKIPETYEEFLKTSKNEWKKIANSDLSIEEASKIGIDKDFAATYKHDSKGVRKSMKVMSNVVYSISKKMKIDKDWKKGLCDESNDEIIDIPK